MSVYVERLIIDGSSAMGAIIWPSCSPVKPVSQSVNRGKFMASDRYKPRQIFFLFVSVPPLLCPTGSVHAAQSRLQPWKQTTLPHWQICSTTSWVPDSSRSRPKKASRTSSLFAPASQQVQAQHQSHSTSSPAAISSASTTKTTVAA